MSAAARLVALLLVVPMAGCAGLGRAPPDDAAPAGATEARPVATESIAPSAASVRERAAIGAPQGGTVAVEPMAPQAAAPVASSAGPRAANTVSPNARTPAKVVASPSPADPLRKNESAAPSRAKQDTPTLDLKSLETRLKETKAIGVFTKIALKNQVDDLLNQFRAYYQGRLKTTLAELRRPYDLLLLKVLALLQDADPPLAGAIAASREAIWSILADPARFATV